MLIRIACAINNKKQFALIKEYLSDLDVQLITGHDGKMPWPELSGSCADIFIFSLAAIPKPIEQSIGLINELPEKPITIVLHEQDSSEEQAKLLSTGIDVLLHSVVSPESLCEAIESTIESRRQFNYASRFDNRGRFQPRLNDFISNSKAMQVFLDETQQFVKSDTSMLLLGETGVGKEHLSKAIHKESNRSNGSFIALNMAAIPDQLLESELFGHERGAFTGAVRSRRGAFEMAHQGTLFLDEIGDMPLQMQSKLLRVLQDLEFKPVGSEESVWVDVRIIAATNKNLEEEIEKGNFRRDLYYRLSVISLTLPPLRKRKEDIPSLANHFLNISNKKVGKNISRFSKEALNALCAYQWPGNIRELMNVIERAVLLCSSGMISLADLPQSFMEESPLDFPINEKSIGLPSDWENKSLSEIKKEVFDRIEKKYFEMVLTRTKGRVGKAAQIAGVHPRGLYGKMKKYGLDKSRFKP
ncbi:sigma-54 interaction domain-containing protein [Desulfospira joergensenii]|uniref:sigma-54 interaction domain-containing protein n=1 Tax=Desulfospira joergensenii TaxID=53329 RepID=UPI0003B51516|nr:sigma-54 dependent transcriptional regulator [Desulfospira joergensenii]